MMFEIICKARVDQAQALPPNLLVVYSRSGIGKSHELRSLCEKFGLRYCPIRPNGNDIGERLRDNNHKNNVIVIEDRDRTFRSPACLDVLNNAADTISRHIPSQRSMKEPEEGIDFVALIVVITNEKMEDASGELGAFISRARYIDLEFLGSPFTKKLALYHLGCETVTEKRTKQNKRYKRDEIAEAINDVLRYWAENLERLKIDPSPRELIKAVENRYYSNAEQFRHIENLKLLQVKPGVGSTPKQVAARLWTYEQPPLIGASSGL